MLVVNRFKKLLFTAALLLLAVFSVTKDVDAAGMSVGNNALNLAAGENVYYGITSGTNTNGNFLLLEKGAGNAIFKIDYAGNITTNGSVLGTNTSYWNASGNNLFASSTAYNVAIGLTNPGAYKLNVTGNTNITGILSATTLTGAYSGTITAPNVSSGSFGGNTGGGDYTFPGVLNISGTNALYFSSYGGGFFMVDSSWIRTSNAKNIWTGGGFLGTDGGVTSGYGGATPPAGGGIFAGNVGIRTTDPKANLHIYASDVTGPATTGSAAFGGFRIDNYAGGLALDMGVREDTNPVYTWIQARGNSNYAVNYNLALNPNGGNVGIGTTNPVGKLQVTLPAWSNWDTDSQHAIFGSGTAGYGVRIGYNETSNFGIINVLKPGVAFGNLILQYSGGNVGIGVTDPGVYKLNVNGNTNITGTLNVTSSVTAGSFSGPMSGTLSSANVSSGAFGSNTGGGNYSFPGNVTAAGNVYINNTSPTVYFQDSDNRSAMIHNNSNFLYILTGSGVNSTTWQQNGSYWPMMIDLTNDAFTFGGSAAFMEGNVGIGTTNSGYKLDVSGVTNINAGNLGRSGLGGVMITAQLDHLDPILKVSEANATGCSGCLRYGQNISVTGAAPLATNIGLYVTAANGGTNYAAIFDQGNVGIGNVNPTTAKLAITPSGTYAIDAGGGRIGPITSSLDTDAASVAYVKAVAAGTSTVPTVGYWTANGTDIKNANSGNVGIGTAASTAKLSIAGGDDGSGTGVLSLTTDGGTNLKLGGNTNYSWIQSHNSKPLYINELGNNVIINPTGGSVGIGTTDPGAYKLNVNGNTNITGTLTATTFSGALSGTVSSANVSSGTFGSNTGGGVYSFGGATVNGNSHYQFEGATYRNPGDFSPQVIIRQDNATVGSLGFKPALSLYNQDGSLNSTVGLTFVSREASGAGSAVELGGIMAIKEIAGNAGAWSSGGLLLYTQNLGAKVDALRILTDGKVGIGTTGPIEKLFVNGAIASNSSSAGYGSAVGTAMMDASGVGSRFLSFGSDAVTRGRYQFYQAGANNAIGQISAVIDSSGNVGIGTTGPHVTAGQINDKYLTIAGGAYPGYGVLELTGQAAGGSSNVGRIVFSNSAVTTERGVATIEVNTANQDSGILSFFTKTTGTSIAERMRITDTGNVGINTTNPGAYRLNVNGDTNITGTLTATTFSGSMSGTLNAANVSSGTFGSNTGGGNYHFPGNVYTDANYGYGLVGVYDSTKYQGIFSMGSSWALAADGSAPGNLYGLAWTHSNAGGQSKAGLSHQLLVMENGVTKVALGSGIWTSGDVSAPNYLVTAGDGYGIKFWGSDSYKISMGVGGLYQYGPVTEYSIKTQMDAGSTGRGFTWGREGIAPIAAINSTSGDMQIAGTLIWSGGNSSHLGTGANVTTYVGNSSVNNALVRSNDNNNDAWIMNWGDSAAYGIYNRNIDSPLVVAGALTVPANSTAFIGASLAKAYIDHSYGNAGFAGTVTAGAFSGPMSGTLSSANVSAGAFGSNTGGGNYSFPGNVTVTGGIQSSDLSRIYSPGGASYTTQTPVVTGAFKIKLPNGSTGKFPMLQFTVNIYSYSTGKTSQIRVGGHFSTADWYNVFAYGMTDNASNYTVRYGRDASGSMCVWIGELASTWDYPQVFVTDFQNGYSALDSSWASGWSIAPVTSFDTVTTSRVVSLGLNTNNYSSYALSLSGGTVTGGVNIVGNLVMSGTANVSGINKITVNTVDPLYNIFGTNYSSFAPSVVGGVKEEVVGKINLDTKVGNEYQAIINFDTQTKGSDLWVWHNVIDFNKDNVEAVITPYGGFANTYYYINGNSLIFKSDRPVEISYRLLAKRFDWQKWPTLAIDQTEKAGLIIK